MRVTPASCRIRFEARLFFESAPEMRCGGVAAAGLRQQLNGKGYELLVRPVLLEQPQAFFGAAERFVLPDMRRAELGKLQVLPC